MFSIRPKRGDIIWRIHVDGCWLQSSNPEKRVDYLFWTKSANGVRRVILLELKGQGIGKALDQIDSTLQRLCKRKSTNQIHRGQHQRSPGHDPVSQGGVLAVVVHTAGRGVPQRLKEIERLREIFGIRVHMHKNRFSVNGLDALPR
ncbi:MAG: hypothetical protein JXA42_24695 [Anaerolineales bacterium]|nr:hypothetical protein [Anaerolineales bacterium]